MDPTHWTREQFVGFDRMPFRLIQLVDLPFHRIQGTPAGILALRILKAEREDCLLADEVWDEELIRKISVDLFKTLLLYISSVGGIDKPAFLKKIKTIEDPQIQNTMKTLAEQFRQEGHQAGHQAGRQAGRQEGQLLGERLLLERLLSRKFGPLPDSVHDTLAKADTSQLEGWGDAVLEATSLNEVFHDS